MDWAAPENPTNIRNLKIRIKKHILVDMCRNQGGEWLSPRVRATALGWEAEEEHSCPSGLCQSWAIGDALCRVAGGAQKKPAQLNPNIGVFLWVPHLAMQDPLCCDPRKGQLPTPTIASQWNPEGSGCPHSGPKVTDIWGG